MFPPLPPWPPLPLWPPLPRPPRPLPQWRPTEEGEHWHSVLWRGVWLRQTTVSACV